MLEELINLKTAMRHNKPKKEVREKFQDYMKAYDDYKPDLKDKIRHREVFLSYARYMYKSDSEKSKT